jgi:predicted O-methyltransferase YrrM
VNGAAAQIEGLSSLYTIQQMARKMSWETAYETLRLLLDDWPSVRLEKYQTLYELARQANAGCIVELGAYHGIGAINLSLGASEGYGAHVYTVDDFRSRKGHSGQTYVPENIERLFQNLAKSGAQVELVNEDLFTAARFWTKPIALLVGDTGDHPPEAFFAVWGRHVIHGGVFAHKLEMWEQPFELPDGWERWTENEEGLIRSIRRKDST